MFNNFENMKLVSTL